MLNRLFAAIILQYIYMYISNHYVVYLKLVYVNYSSI